MSKFFITIISLFFINMGFSQTKITLSANGKTMTATLAENNATEELLKILPVTIEMTPYGGFEVVGPLPQSLPTSNSQITTVPGDIMLYQGNQLVIFYGNNSWSYTRIGKIDGATAYNVKEFLGNGDVTVTLSRENASIPELKVEDLQGTEIYDLNGIKTDPSKISTPGVYLLNGKKFLLK